jgi:hypothetical protein
MLVTTRFLYMSLTLFFQVPTQPSKQVEDMRPSANTRIYETLEKVIFQSEINV